MRYSSTRFRASSGAIAAVVAAGALLPADADAQGRRVQIIRDAEIESVMRSYTNPVLEAAGIGAGTVGVVLIGDPRFNAFVADGRSIYLNTGAILQTETPNELIGVLAHETGHLAGGHLARLRDAAGRAQMIGMLTSLLGVGAAAAIAATGGSPAAAQGAAGAAAGGQSIAQRTFLAYARSEESAADRAAISYLERLQQSPNGMIKVFKRLQDQNLFALKYADPYALSHPTPANRIAQIQDLASKSPYRDKKDPPERQFRHDMVKAKLLGFTGNGGRIRNAYPRSDKSLPARYARAIAAYRFGKPRNATKAIDRLIQEQPNNPYFWELKGQALIDTGSPKKAIEPLRKAVALSRGNGLIRIQLGRALVGANDDRYLDEAIRELRTGMSPENASVLGFRVLAQAYARKGQLAMASLSTAQGHFINGELQPAKVHAKRAQVKLKRGSPAWLQAEDILSYKPKKLR